MELIYGLQEYQWGKIKDSLLGKPGDLGRLTLDNRLFIEAINLSILEDSPLIMIKQR